MQHLPWSWGGRAAELRRRQQQWGVVGVEAPGSSEHPNAGGAAGGPLAQSWHGAGRRHPELLLNLALPALRCVVGLLAGWELPGISSWQRSVKRQLGLTAPALASVGFAFLS